MSKRLPDYRFNMKNSTEINMLKIAKNSEKYITKDCFLKNGTSHIFNNWRNAGYVKKVEGKDGLLRLTDRFFDAYKSQISYDTNTAGSCSRAHSLGVLQALQNLPQSLKLENIRNGTEVQNEFSSWKKTDGKSEYRDTENKIKDSYLRDVNVAKERAEIAKIQGDKTAYLDARDDIKKGEVLLGYKSLCSTPDLLVDMTKNQLEEWQNTLKERLEDGNYSHKIEAKYEQALAKIEQIVTTMTTVTVSIGVEVVTSSYQWDDYVIHENYEQFTDTQIVFVPSR